MTASKAHLDAVFDNVDVMQKLASKLDRLARAFDETGNVKVAGELYDIGDSLFVAAERVRDTFSAAKSEELAYHEAHMGNILSILLNPVTGED